MRCGQNFATAVTDRSVSRLQPLKSMYVARVNRCNNAMTISSVASGLMPSRTRTASGIMLCHALHALSAPVSSLALSKLATWYTSMLPLPVKS